jgi:hypothetical protein
MQWEQSPAKQSPGSRRLREAALSVRFQIAYLESIRDHVVT